MTDTAPERIWARPQSHYGDVGDWRMGDWKRNNLAGDLVEYTRSDLTGWRDIKEADRFGEYLVGCWTGEGASRAWVTWVAFDEWGCLEFGGEAEFDAPPTHFFALPTPPEAKP